MLRNFKILLRVWDKAAPGCLRGQMYRYIVSSDASALRPPGAGIVTSLT